MLQGFISIYNRYMAGAQSGIDRSSDREHNFFQYSMFSLHGGLGSSQVEVDRCRAGENRGIHVRYLDGKVAGRVVQVRVKHLHVVAP